MVLFAATRNQSAHQSDPCNWIRRKMIPSLNLFLHIILRCARHSFQRCPDVRAPLDHFSSAIWCKLLRLMLNLTLTLHCSRISFSPLANPTICRRAENTRIADLWNECSRPPSVPYAQPVKCSPQPLHSAYLTRWPRLFAISSHKHESAPLALPSPGASEFREAMHLIADDYLPYTEWVARGQEVRALVHPRYLRPLLRHREG